MAFKFRFWPSEYKNLGSFASLTVARKKNWKTQGTLTGIGILLSWKATSDARNTSLMDAPLTWKLPSISFW
jgi:hypothetical protein